MRIEEFGNFEFYGDVDAERAVLGRLLMQRARISAFSGLRREYFYFASHKQIWGAIEALAQDGREHAAIDVNAWLRSKSLLDITGEAAASEIAKWAVEGTIEGLGVLYGDPARFSERIIDCYHRRSAIRSLHEAYDLLKNTGLPLAEVLPQARGLALSGLSMDGLGLEVPVTDFIEASYELFIELSSPPRPENLPIPTGLFGLDELVQGLNRKNLWVIAGESSSGKSALLLQIFIESVMAQNPSLLFSLEMARGECLRRVYSYTLQQNMINAKHLSEPLVEMGMAAIKNFESLLPKGEIFDEEAVTLEQIEAAALAFIEKHGSIRLIAIDHLQLLESPNSYGAQRHVELDKQARQLKRLAKRLNCTVIALSQVNRATAQSADKRPTLASIRDSSAIATHADVVIGLYRDQMHNPDSRDRGTAELIVLKNRNGQIGTAKLLFDGALSEFRNLSRGLG